MAHATNTAKAAPQKHSAGAFDIRNVIGALMGIYGVVLLISAFLLDPGTNFAGVEKNGSYNIWTGIALIIVALIFMAWAKARPIIVPDEMPGDAAPAEGR